jgi:two-component system, OmpR family, phosphate regulon sensor histidine kinase PhoR
MNKNSNQPSPAIFARAFIESPVIMSISTLKDGRFLEVNKTFCATLGFAREETLGRTSTELGLWAETSTRQELIEALKQNQRIPKMEVKIRTQSGVVLTCLTSAEIFEADSEQYLLILMEDISAKKRSEAALAASQQRLHQISEVVRDIIYSIALHPQPLIDYISPSLEQVLGYTPEEVLKDPAWLQKNVYPDDLVELYSFFKVPEKSLAVQPVVLRWLHKDGKTVWLEHRSSLVFDQNGQVNGLIGISRDISLRKKAEEQIQLNEARLESLLKLSQFNDPEVQHLLDFALQEAIKLTNSRDGYIYYFREEREEFVLSTWSQGQAESAQSASLPSDLNLLFNGLWAESVRQRKPIVVNDFAGNDPLVKKYWPEVHDLSSFICIPVLVKDKVAAVICLVDKLGGYDQSDIRQLTLLADTTWKLVERRVDSQKLEESYQNEKKQREELQQEALARGMFIDILAHELRTPLTPILASSGMLLDILKEDAETERKLTVNLYNSANNMAHRLEELLDLARYARGTFRLSLRTVNLSIYLKEVVEQFLPTIEQNKQYIRLNIDGYLPPAQIDAPRLKQVINNLLSNASKFSPETSEIGFTAWSENNALRVDVKDQGAGVSTPDQEMLFQPYHRVEQDRQKYPGIGLGLAVARQIVEAHGGRIWVTSRTGEGSTFSFEIPLKSSGKSYGGLL